MRRRQNRTHRLPADAPEKDVLRPPESNQRMRDFSAMLQSILPAIVYILCCQVLLSLLESCLGLLQSFSIKEVLQNGDFMTAKSLQTVGTAAMQNLQALNTAVAALGALCVTMRFLKVRPKPYRPEGRLHRVPSRMEYGFLVLGTMSGSMALNALLQESGAVAADAAASAAAGQTQKVSILIGVMVYGIAVPYAEEEIFRGITFERLWESSGSLILGTAGSALLFGISHGNLVQGCYAAVMGVMFCNFLARTENLRAVIALHGAINIFTLVLSRANAYNGISGRVIFYTGLGVFICCIIGICGVNSGNRGRRE